MRKSRKQYFLEALDRSNATAQVAPEPLKSLTNLSESTVKGYAVHREDLKPC